MKEYILTEFSSRQKVEIQQRVIVSPAVRDLGKGIVLKKGAYDMRGRGKYL